MAENPGAGRTADRLLRVLGLLATTPECTVDDIAHRTGIPTSTVYRFLAAIGEHGFAHRLSPGVYAAGPVAIQFAEQYRRHALERSAIERALARLSTETGELAAFMVALGTEALCVHVAESLHTLRCAFSVGETQPLLRGATALALLSRLPDARRRAVADRYELAPEQIAELEAARLRVRAAGIATSVGALDDGVWGASAPVVDSDGALIGAVTVMAPEARVLHRKPRLERLVAQTAFELSGGLA